ncbi:MAG: hypothetical protein E7656_00125 [Ruminococcaceae bacterium]|nr:hypothetical protein [Oscillospiraceae bacterium]
MNREYTLSTPIIADLFTGDYREKAVNELRRIGSKRVFLAICFYHNDSKAREEILNNLEDSIQYLKDSGFEVGVWMWTLIIKEKNDFRKLTDPKGVASDAYICPTDENFVTFATEYVADIARCKPNIILFDDDFRYNYGDLGCCCDEHLRLFKEKTGVSAKPADIFNMCFTGKPNNYRSAWLTIMGDSFKKLAYKIRKTINSVDPNIRCGFCTSDSSWGLDGFDAIEMSKILAGDTKPIIRLFGAPYWYNYYGFSLAHIVENERMAASWCEKEDVENMSEGDVYPRPRYAVPASHLECFDMILRADGVANGILKYTFDYTSDALFETGYNDFHCANRSIYEMLDKHFAHKKPFGVRVFEYPRRIFDAELPQKNPDADYIHRYTFDSHAGKILSACNIPICRSGEDMPGAVFGENARHIPENALDNGMILDIKAAKILTERGFDVGLSNIIEEYTPVEEIFSDGERIKIWGKTGLFRIEPKKGAVVDSWYTTRLDYSYGSYVGNPVETPSAYFYENNKKQRFFVMAFDSVFCEKSAYRSYYKAEQLKRAIEYVSGKILPVSLTKPSPDLYILCKKDDNSMSIGLWNLFDDKIPCPEIEISDNFSKVSFVNTQGIFEGNKVKLSTLYPYEFAGIILEK